MCNGVGQYKGIVYPKHAWLPDVMQINGGYGNPWQARYIEIGKWCCHCGKSKKGNR